MRQAIYIYNVYIDMNTNTEHTQSVYNHDITGERFSRYHSCNGGKKRAQFPLTCISTMSMIVK